MAQKTLLPSPFTHVSVAVAADMLGVNPSTIRRRAAAGDIPGAVKERRGLIGYRWMIPLAYIHDVTSFPGYGEDVE
ncbi:MAG: hypothetical protein CUN56_00065 [Phototrophicales bacterium]|nr:MAG: hypothetical protein CUN56_00065 [Phototrophicales bacterium]